MDRVFLERELLLDIRNLRTYFAGSSGFIRAVDGIDLQVPAGSTVCIVGESGSGKSVTARSVMQLVDPPGFIQPGSEVIFEGRNLVGLPEKGLEKLRGGRISMIFQEPMSSLNPVLSVGEQIAEVVRIHGRATRRQAYERAVEMMELVGIPAAATRARDYPHQMSGGMLQRITIAMALSCNPALLIADEPTTALDVTVQAQILDIMRRLQDEFGMAILLITHDLGVVAEMAQVVTVMYAGQIVESGPVEAIFENPRHPYTEALLRSLPRLGATQEQPLYDIPGMVPSAASWPRGCRFAARCGYAFDRCVEESPPMFTSTDHAARCWLREADRWTLPKDGDG